MGHFSCAHAQHGISCIVMVLYINCICICGCPRCGHTNHTFAKRRTKLICRLRSFFSFRPKPFKRFSQFLALRMRSFSLVIDVVVVVVSIVEYEKWPKTDKTRPKCVLINGQKHKISFLPKQFSTIIVSLSLSHLRSYDSWLLNT